MKKILIGCAAFIFVLILIWKVAKQPSFQIFGDLIYRVDTPDRVVALTFDDVPSPHNTEEILAILRDNSIRATFFMVGKNIEKFPGLARAVLTDGHQLANHSFSHKRMIFDSTEFCRNEILKTDKAIRALGFQDEIVFRPPFGKKLVSLPWVLSDLGKLTVTWDAESEDTEYQDPDVLEQNVMSRVRRGSIILFHDGGGRKDATIKAVKSVVRILKAQGFTFLTVNELRRNGLRHAAAKRYAQQ